MDDAAVAHEHGSLDRVLELANVARPVIRREHVDRRRRDAPDALAVFARVLLDEVIGEQHDVRLPLAQRRREDGEDGQPVVQVGAEPPFLHQRFERLVGRGDQPDVDLDRCRAAETLDLALLQHAQQLDLGRRVEVADLVEEERPAFGELEPAFLRRLRAGERAPFVAEELRLDQRLGQRRGS